MSERILSRLASNVGRFAMAMAVVMTWTGATLACGENSDCAVPSGDYRYFLPASIPQGGKVPAIIYIHGLGGSSKAVMANAGFRRAAENLGVAFVAVNGRAGSWSFPNGVERGRVRDEFAYFSEVVDDIKKRLPVDGEKIVAAGFSIGASMVWNLACREPENYAGFIPVAGTMWRPQPEKCVKPVGEIYHFHGTQDRIFPLEGRFVEGKRQGAILDTFEIVYRQDACTRRAVAETKAEGAMCMLHRNCGGETVRLCLHGGAHSVKAAYLEEGFREIAKDRGWQGF